MTYDFGADLHQRQAEGDPDWGSTFPNPGKDGVQAQVTGRSKIDSEVATSSSDLLRDYLPDYLRDYLRDYPLTAPAESPDTRERCRARNSNITGSDTRIDPAAK